MVNEKASKWVLGIIVYFILLSSVFVIVNDFKSDYSLTDSTLINSSGGSSNIDLKIGDCSNPRFSIFDDSDSGYVNNADELNTKYWLLYERGYIADGTECESFEGASWEQRTFLTIPYGDEICNGIIDLTYYNDGVFFSDVNFVDYLTNKSLSVCDLSSLTNNKYLCESFGCVYVSEGNIQEVTEFVSVTGSFKALSGLVSTTSDIITLRVEFYTESSLLNGLLTFVLIWLPIFGLLLAVYELVRG